MFGLPNLGHIAGQRIDAPASEPDLTPDKTASEPVDAEVSEADRAAAVERRGEKVDEAAKKAHERGRRVKESVDDTLSKNPKVTQRVAEILADRDGLQDFVTVLQSERFRGYRPWNEAFKRAYFPDEMPLGEVMAYVKAMQKSLDAKLVIDGKLGRNTLGALARFLKSDRSVDRPELTDTSQPEVEPERQSDSISVEPVPEAVVEKPIPKLDLASLRGKIRLAKWESALFTHPDVLQIENTLDKYGYYDPVALLNATERLMAYFTKKYDRNEMLRRYGVAVRAYKDVPNEQIVSMILEKEFDVPKKVAQALPGQLEATSIDLPDKPYAYHSLKGVQGAVRRDFDVIGDVYAAPKAAARLYLWMKANKPNADQLARFNVPSTLLSASNNVPRDATVAVMKQVGLSSAVTGAIIDQLA